jgi:DNA-binding transcriptional LysR family regulator
MSSTPPASPGVMIVMGRDGHAGSAPQATAGSTSAMPSRSRERDLDIGCSCGGEEVGWPKAPDLVCRRIGESRFRVLASPSYWSAHGKPQEPKDLERHVCFNIRGNYGRVMDVWNFAKGSEQQTVVARGWLTTSNAHRALVHQLVLRGHGVGRFVDWADTPEVAAGALVPALSDWEATDVPPVNVLYAAATRRNPRARLFIQFMTELFADLDRARGLRASGTGPPPWMRRANGRASDFLDHKDRSR